MGSLAGLLGRVDEAEGYFTEALDVSQKLGSPYWTARTQFAWAQLDRKAGPDEADRAETMLTDALHSAERRRFGALVEQINRIHA